MNVTDCTCDPVPVVVLPDSKHVHLTDERGLWHAEQVGERVHGMYLLEPSAEEQERIDARAEEAAEQARDHQLAAALDRRDRALALVLLRASSRWSTLTAAQRQRLQARIDALAEPVWERVQDLLT